MATILIIDDEEIIRVLLRSALEAEGYEVTRLPTVVRDLSCTARGRRIWIITDIVIARTEWLDMLLELRVNSSTQGDRDFSAGEEKNVFGCRETPRARQTLPEAL